MPRPNDRPATAGRGTRPTIRLTRILFSLALFLTTLAPRPVLSADSAVGTGATLADTPLVFDTNLGLIQRATEEAIERALEGLRLPPGSEIQLFGVLKLDGDWFVEDRIANYLSGKGYKVYLIEKPKAKTPGTALEGDLDGDGVISIPEATALSTPGGRPAATNADTASALGNLGSAVDSVVSAPPSNPVTSNDEARAASNPTGPTSKNPNAAGPPAGSLTPVLNEFPEGVEGLVLSFRVVEFGVTYHDQWRQGFLGQRVVERLAAVDLNCRLVSGDEKNIIWVGNGRSERLDIVPKSKLDLLEGRSYPFIKPALPPQSLSRIVEPVLVLGIVAGLVFLFYSNQN